MGKKKNKCAQSLGSRGGKNGGPARAKKLSATKRSQIAAKGGRAKGTK